MTNCIHTFVYMCHKRIQKDRRYLLSTDELAKAKKRKENPIFEALKIQAMKDKNPHLTNNQIAKNLGKSRVRITQVLNLLKLPPEIQKHILLSENIFTERQLRPLI